MEVDHLITEVIRAGEEEEVLEVVGDVET